MSIVKIGSKRGNLKTMVISKEVKGFYQLRKYRKKWKYTDSISLFLSNSLTSQEIRNMTKFLFETIPCDFTYALLSEISENNKTPLDILEEIFDKGNTGIKVSISLREDINDKVKLKAIKFNEYYVLQHIIYKKSITNEERIEIKKRTETELKILRENIEKINKNSFKQLESLQEEIIMKENLIDDINKLIQNQNK